jgi:hypothetical protein
MLAVPLLYLPLALRFGLRAILYSFGAAMPVFVSIQFFVRDPQTAAQVMMLCTILGVAGCAWTHWEIARGRHAYRVQPLIPARWRGQG